MKEINLRPYREKEEKRILKNFKLSIAVSVLCSILFIGHQYNEHNKTLDTYENRSTAIEEKLNYINNYNEANKDIETERRQALEKLSVSYSLYKGKLNTAMILDELTYIFPAKDGKLNKLVKNKSKIIINGTLNNEESFYSFLDSMEESVTMSSYTVNEINNSDEKVKFEIQIFESTQ